MALTLEITKANGTVIANPLTQAKTQVSVLPGDTVRIVDAATGKTPINLRVKKVGDSLMVDGLPEGQVVELGNFYSACSPAASCALEIDAIGAGGAPTVVTPATQPVALLGDGQALMYGADPTAATLAPAAGAGMAASPAVVGGALLGVVAVGAAAGGGGGGGGGGADRVAPGAPVIARAEQTVDGVTVSGTAEANSTVTITLGSLTQTIKADASGNWTASFNDSGLPDGAVNVSATATDEAGNTSVASASRSVTIDQTAPAAPAIALATTTAGGDVDVRGSAEPGSQVKVTLGAATQTITADANGNWQTVFAGAAAGAAATVSVTATDAVGNASAAATQAIALINQPDTTPPDAPSITAAVQGANGDVQVSGTAEAGATVTVTLGSVSASAVADGFGHWSLSFAKASLSDGTFALSARATDAANNQGPASASQNVAVDLTPPVAPTVDHVGLGQVINQAVLANSSGFTISGTAEAGSQVVVSLGSVTYGAVQADGAGHWTLTVPQGGSLPADGPSVSSIAVSTDAHGNSSTSLPFAVHIDRVAPAAPTDVTYLNGQLTGHAEPGALVLIDVGNDGTPGVPSIEATATADSTGRWTTTTLAAQTPGTVISVVAQDTVNNGSSEVLYTVPSASAGGGATIVTGDATSNVLIGDAGGGVRNGSFQYWDLRDTSTQGGANRTSGWGGLSGFMDPASLGWTILDEGATFSGAPVPVYGVDTPDGFAGQVMGSYFISGFGTPGPGTDGHSFVTYALDGNDRSTGWDTSSVHEAGGSGIEQTIITVQGTAYMLSMDVWGLTGSAASFKVYFGDSTTPLATFDGTANGGVGAWSGTAPGGAGTGTDHETWTWTVTAADSSSLLRIETFVSTSTVTNDPGVRVASIDLQSNTAGGADTISGGAGADLIYGQGGDDTLYGGAAGTPDFDRDTFVYSLRSDNGNDVIKDFDVGVDRIALIDVLDVAGISVAPDTTAGHNYGDLNLDADDLSVGGGQRVVIGSSGGDLKLDFYGADNTALGSVTLEGVAADSTNDTLAELISSNLLVMTSDGFSSRLLLDASAQGHLIA